MSHGYGSSGRDKLIRVLREKGLSVRKAERAIEAVFGTMANALRRGEVIEIPGGTLRVVMPGRRRTELHRFRDFNGKTKYRLLVLDRQPKQIRFTPNPQLELDIKEE